MTIRKSIALIFYLTMIAGGGMAAWQWLVNGGKGVAFMLGAFPALFGAYLLWTDFISPSRQRLWLRFDTSFVGFGSLGTNALDASVHDGWVAVCLATVTQS